MFTYGSLILLKRYTKAKLEIAMKGIRYKRNIVEEPKRSPCVYEKSEGIRSIGSVFFNPKRVTENMKSALINVPKSICGLGISRGIRMAKEYVISNWTFSDLSISNCLFSRIIL